MKWDVMKWGEIRCIEVKWEEMWWGEISYSEVR